MRQRPRQDAQRLDESGDGEAAVVADEIGAGRAQPVAAEPEDVDRRLDARAARATSAPAYRSPEASPQEIITRGPAAVGDVADHAGGRAGGRRGRPRLGRAVRRASASSDRGSASGMRSKSPKPSALS